MEPAHAELAAEWEREDSNRTPQTELDVPQDLSGLFTEDDLDDPMMFDDADAGDYAEA